MALYRPLKADELFLLREWLLCLQICSRCWWAGWQWLLRSDTGEIASVSISEMICFSGKQLALQEPELLHCACLKDASFHSASVGRGAALRCWSMLCTLCEATAQFSCCYHHLLFFFFFSLFLRTLYFVLKWSSISDVRDALHLVWDLCCAGPIMDKKRARKLNKTPTGRKCTALKL